MREDWVTPRWFPIRRVSDDDLDSNEIEFQLRVNAVMEGKMSPEEAEAVRAEYRERRRFEKLKRDGVAADATLEEGMDAYRRMGEERLASASAPASASASAAAALASAAERQKGKEDGDGAGRGGGQSRGGWFRRLRGGDEK